MRAIMKPCSLTGWARRRVSAAQGWQRGAKLRGGPLGGLGGAEVADHPLVGESPAARAGELAAEDVVDRPLPVYLHVRCLRGDPVRGSGAGSVSVSNMIAVLSGLSTAYWLAPGPGGGGGGGGRPGGSS